MLILTTATGRRWGIFAVLAIAANLAGCAGYGGQTVSEKSTAALPAHNVGYLSPEALPSSVALLPLPPATDSAASALDLEISRRSFTLRDTPRWHLAVADADLRFPQAPQSFSCALNTAIPEADAPRLHRLLRRTLIDIGRSTDAAKQEYLRPRPFMTNNQPLCTPEAKVQLEKNGSYPSGHSAIGWGWALILAEISPAQADAVLARGRDFGESRNVCNVHWHSDVIQGRVIAAGTVARLHADPEFQADLQAAGAELASLRQKELKPERDCHAEAAALALQPPLAP